MPRFTRQLSVLIVLALAACAPSLFAQATPPCYVKKATARETLEASLAQARQNAPVLSPWQYAGPFDNTDNKGFDTAYPPEQGVDLAATYTGKAGQAVRWKDGSQFVDGKPHNPNLFQDNNRFAIYFYRTITAQQATQLKVSFGSDDTLTVWLNGKQIHANRNSRGLRVGEDHLTLDLLAGKNELLAKVCQGEGGWGFAFDLDDRDSTTDAIQQQILRDFPPEQIRQIDVELEWRQQYDVLKEQIATRERINRFASTTRNPAALIDEKDRDPADVVLRRTTNLLDDLAARNAGHDYKPQQQRLADLKARASGIDPASVEPRIALFIDACRLRREIAFSNPLLDFSQILFVKHERCGPNEGVGNHMCDQYMGFKAVPGGGLYVLEDAFSPAPKLRDVLKDSSVKAGRLAGKPLASTGSFLSPALSYDAKTISFAYVEKGKGDNWSLEKCWHVFKVNADGTDLVQLTDGEWNEFDPCFLPSGRMAFISERRGGFGRCHGRPVPVFTLHSMEEDGSDIVCLSYHESNEWHPSVNHDGMIVYTRWDYVDRGFNQAHHPWITTPDGRDARAIQGNYPNNIGSRPWMEMHCRPIPNSRKYVSTAAPHHGQAYGSLVLVDPQVPDDDAMSAVRRLTPDAGFPEGEDNNPYPYGMRYGTAWPLSEDYHLCVYSPKSEKHGIYLIDSFGNKELIYRDPQIACLNPIPFKTRPVPPVVPHQTLVGRPRTAPPAPAVAPADEEPVVTLINVYDSLKAWPTGTKIKALRIMQVLPKTTPPADNPRIGHGAQKGARAVLGTVPVEEDGSARFTVPARKAIFFQALDERGMAVQTMRSDTYLHPGERLTCQGCHNQTTRSPQPASHIPAALSRPPSKIQPDVDGSRPFNYPRLVQGVLDRNCVACHDRERPSKPKAIDLSGAKGRDHGWSVSFINLRPYVTFFDDPVATTSRSIPGQIGAHGSQLFKILDKGHYDVKLSPEDFHRLTLWMDANCDFYGAYEKTDAQSRGEIVWPSLE